MAQFQGAVKRLDEGLGRIMDAFDRHGLAENTIFVFTTDHGIDMPRAKGTFYDPGLETFLFMRYPGGGWEAGSVREELTTNVDILPTLLEACGIDVPERVQGRSFLPLLSGGAYEPRDMVFSEKTFHDTYDPTRCIRTDRYKYIRYFEVNIFQDLRLATITRRDYFKDDWRRRTIEELYDLENDPDEMHNLVDDAAHAETLERMRRELITWMRQTEDPLLEGPVSSPRYRQELEALKQLG
jgi:arylsulfatase A-like enzyme